MLHFPPVSVRSRILLICLLAVLVGLPRTPVQVRVQAQVPPAQQCYAVADGGDAVWEIDPVTGTTSRIGPLGAAYRNVEAIAFNLDATILYAADDNGLNGLFGRINMGTGAFSPIGSIGPGNGIDPATGLATTDALRDVDSLSIHPLTGDMWGITQDSGENKVFRINVTTGAVIPNTFGPGLDYAQIVLPPALTDVDDLGIDPTTGIFYIVANNDSGNDHLYRLNINGLNPPASPGLNATLGTITSSQIARFTLAGSPGTFITDMEGFAFFNDGTFYGTTGDQSTGGWDDTMWRINTTTGVVTAVTAGPIDNDGVPPSNNDFEAVECLSAGINIKTGIAFEDLDFNGVFNGADRPYAGATIYFHRDNGNGTFDGAPSDALIEAATTGADGVYRFGVATAGTFFVVLNPATLPAGAAMSTVGSYTVNFVNFDNNLVNNNFGFGMQQPPPDPTLTPRSTSAVTPQPGDTPVPGGRPLLVKSAQPSTVLPGELVAFTIRVTNPTVYPITGVVITDTLDAAFFDAILEVSTTKGTAVISGPLTVTVTLDTLAPGESVAVTIVARVRVDLTGPKSTENVAIMVSREDPVPVEARVPVVLIMLPNTGYPPAVPEPSARSTQTALIVLAVTLLGVLWVLRRRTAH